MAQMYPKNIEGLYPPASREGDVFNELAKLPDDWVILHSVREIAGGNYEADFTIMIPERGYLIMEVKNIKFDIEDGVWTFCDSYGNPHRLGKKTPLNQASIAASKFHKNRLASKQIASTLDAEFSHAALLLKHEEDDEELLQAIPEQERKFYFLSETLLKDTERLRQRILDCFKYGEHHRFTREVICKIVDELAASYYYKNMSHEDYSDYMAAATANISELFSMTRHSTADVCVEGCAGSGKTVMLINEVKRLWAEAKEKGEEQRLRILVLCYNRNLMAHLMKQLEDCRGVRVCAAGADKAPLMKQLEDCKGVRVENFHTLVKWIAQNAGISLQAPNRDPSVAELKAIRDVLRSQVNHEAYSFHHVFIDEAQDMKNAWWQYVLPHLTRCERPDGTPGRMYLFMDSNQNLYQPVLGNGEESAEGSDGGGDDELWLPACSLHIQLDRNLRNSAQIARFSANILPEEQVKPKPMDGLRGIEVQICPGADSVMQRRQTVNDIIEHILSDKVNNVSRRNIVVLSPYRADEQNPDRSSLTSCPAILPSSPDDERNFRSWNGVLASTIKGFKGLEALFVILVDIGPIGSSKALSRNDFYVACTRAKYGLYIVPTVAGEKAARELLE